MPKVNITQITTTDMFTKQKKQVFEINYACECGKIIKYLSEVKPDKLEKCFDCLSSLNCEGL
jgi:hypothetical protein